MMSDPIIIDPRLLVALKTYVEYKHDRLSCLIAKFLNAYINGTRFVESFEIDNFILRNEAVLCAWYVIRNCALNNVLTDVNVARGSSMEFNCQSSQIFDPRC